MTVRIIASSFRYRPQRGTAWGLQETLARTRPMGKGVSEKKAAAAEKQASLAAERARQKAEADERAEAVAWSAGADLRASKKREEAERKAAEKDAKKAEMQKLLQEEESMAASVKARSKKNKVVKSSEMKELEAQLKAMEMEKKKKEEKTKAAQAPAQKAKRRGGCASSDEDSDVDENVEGRHSRGSTGSFIPVAPLEANPNRMSSDVEIAHGLDQALDLLSDGVAGGGGGGGGAVEKHPERRQKAAYQAYYERMLPELKEELPGLKLSQYKDRIFESWKKSPENPMNQARAAGGGR